MSKQSDIVKVSQDAGTTGFVNVSGDTMTGGLNITGSNFASITYTGSSVNPTGVYTGLTSDGGFANNVRDSGYLQFSTNNTERMRIDSAGRVTKPWQPIWGGRHSGGNLNSYVTMYNDAAFTNGSGWVLSGGINERLYPPVSGWYEITMQGLANPSVNSLGHTQAMLYKNGVSQYNLCAGTYNYTRMIIHAYLYLTPSDWISFYTAGTAMHTDQAYNKVTCMLVA